MTQAPPTTPQADGIKFNPKKPVRIVKVPKTISFRPDSDNFYERIWIACRDRDMVMNDFMNQAIDFALNHMEKK